MFPMLVDYQPPLPIEIPATAYRPRHWSGDPDACSATCDGPHHGDHIDPDAVCGQCGGAARLCYTGPTSGCAYTIGPDV